MYDLPIAMIDTRQVRDVLNLLIFKMDISTSEDTISIITMYGLPNLVADLIHYGALYNDIPGRPHYAIIEDILSKQYNSVIDREILDIILEEIEWVVYHEICKHPGSLQIVRISPPLLFARLIYVDY